MILGVIVSRAAFLGASTIFSFGGAINHPQRSSLEHDSGASSLVVSLNDITISNNDLSTQASAIRLKVNQVLQQEDPSLLAGPLIRLAFHDAGSRDGRNGGLNGSIRYELEWNENRGLSKPLNVVMRIWNTTADSLSLADIIALAGAQAVESTGGPHVPIKLGRIDVTEADSQYLHRPIQGGTMDHSLVTRTLPSPGLTSVGLRRYFSRFHLSESEFVALSGIHGLGRHVSLLNMSKVCLKNLTRTCLEEAPTLLPFVTSSVDRFDNSYFVFLLKWYHREIELGETAFLPTDVALVVDSGLRRHVETFARNEDLYRRTFVRAFQKLVDTTATTRERY